MKVSVIIAHDERRGDSSLKECVASVKAQGCTEIIVATRGNKSEARNRAAREATGEILVFFDDDVALRKHCIEELLDPFCDEKVGIVGGVNIAFPKADFRERIGGALLASTVTMFRSAARYTPRGNVRETDESEIILCNMAIRKDVFIKAGGFPEECWPCEENVLITNVQNLGYKVIYNPFAVVYHSRPKVFKEYASKIFSYGVGRGMFIRQYGKEGKMRMFWKPNKRWLYYAVGFILHYVAYPAGVLYGLIKGGQKRNQK